MKIHEISLFIEDEDSRENTLPKTLFLKTLTHVSRGFGEKERLLTRALLKAVTGRYEGHWRNNTTYLYMMIKHLEILNRDYPDLLIPFMHAVIHASVLGRDVCAKFLVNWETLFTEALETQSLPCACAKSRKRFIREIRSYLQAFVRIVLGNRNKPISEDILLSRLMDRTLHRLYRMGNGDSMMNVSNNSTTGELIGEIQHAPFSDLEKNSLIRIIGLMERTGNRDRVARVRQTIQSLIELKCKECSEDLHGNQMCLGSLGYHEPRDQSLLQEIENLLVYLIHEENNNDNAVNE